MNTQEELNIKCLKRNEYMRQWRLKNIDKQLVKEKKRRDDAKINHPGRHNSYALNYYYRNKEKCLASNKRWKHSSDHYKNQQKEYRKQQSLNGKSLAYQIQRRYGITPEEYETMLKSQDHVCAICKKPETRINPMSKRVGRLAVDHNHTTNQIRGLLCKRCNQVLGAFGDDLDLFSSAISYLQKYEINEAKAA